MPLSLCNQESLRIIQDAANIAYERRHVSLDVDHLTFTVLYMPQGEFLQILEHCLGSVSGDISFIRNDIDTLFRKKQKTTKIDKGIPKAKSFMDALAYADKIRVFLHQPQITPFFLLLGILAFTNSSRTILHKHDFYQKELIDGYREYHKAKKNLSTLKILENDEEKVNKLLKLEEYFTNNIYGQSEAIQKINEILRRVLLGFRNTEKPIASLLFCGEEGIGKKKTAELINLFVFQNPSSFLYIDAKKFAAQSRRNPFSYGGVCSAFAKKNNFGLIYIDNTQELSYEIRKKISNIVNVQESTDENHQSYVNFIVIFGYLPDTKKKNIGFASTVLSYSTIDKKNKQTLQKYLLQDFEKKYLEEIDMIIPFNTLSMDAYLLITHKYMQEIQNMVKIEKSLEFIINAKSLQIIHDLIFEQGMSLIIYKKKIFEYCSKFIGDTILEAAMTRKFLGDNKKYLEIYIDETGVFGYTDKRLNAEPKR